MKKLVYIANLRIPTEKAYGIQIAKTCEAMADLGCSVTLLCPFRISKVKDNFFDYYGINKNFAFKKIFIPDFYLSGFLNKVAFAIKSFYSAFVLALYALARGADYFYTRDELVAYILSFFKKNIIFEGHKFSSNRGIFYSRFRARQMKIVVISDGLRKGFIDFGIKEQDLLTARDGVDVNLFNLDITKEEARKKTNLPQYKTIIMYTGHLYEWKGANVLLETARKSEIRNPKSEILFVFVGGTDQDIKKFRQKAKGLNNVLILGHRPHNQIPILLKAADILVLPNSMNEEISKYYTSPLKLFEYMTARRPIVASDLPAIREVLNDTNAILVKSNNSESLADGIERALSDTTRAEKAFQDVQQYTWRKRADKILNFIK